MTSTLAHSINPHAGWHAISHDPRDVEAARRAVTASLAEFPYYHERYGDSAGLFGASDGAWLAMLCQGEPEYVRGQVLWLGTVLSARGMPRLLLERHLELLHRELLLSTADEDRCRPLLDAAHLLRAARQQHIAQTDADALAAAFEARADAAWLRRLPRMGAILVASACDEAAGIGRAVGSVEEWAADSARFPASWTDAVAQTLADARSRARAHPRRRS
jgi:hypothetical protein